MNPSCGVCSGGLERVRKFISGEALTPAVYIHQVEPTDHHTPMPTAAN